jgi:prepilin-type N-terminal cleavage/methylation domain-containing protein
MKRSARGFTLVEALVALVVLAFGMMALAGFQTSLSRNSDIAKQRTEATRLAQQKMEELRSLAWADLAGGSDSPAPVGGNTSYVRSWDLSAPSQDPWRSVSVTVRWNDRAGEVNTVNLNSAISRAAAADGAVLGLPAVSDGILHRPSGRPLDIRLPIPSISIGGGQSAVGVGSTWFVFSDTTGEVINYCTTVVPTPQGCVSAAGYLLAGYINDGALNNVDNFAWPLTAPSFTATQFMLSHDCAIGAAINPNTGAPQPDFRFYVCRVEPSDHDSNAATPPVWTGKLVLEPPPSGSQVVCRYDGNATDPFGVYQRVSSSLDNQNYLVLGSGPCPSGTTQHQP